MISDSLAFIIVFVTTRRFLGGYHANTKIKCLVLDILVWAFNTNLYVLPNNSYIGLIVFLLSVIVTCRYAPVENKHKRINEVQKKCNKAKGLMMIAIFSIGSVVFRGVSVNVAHTVDMTLVSVDLLILAGRRANVKGEIR